MTNAAEVTRILHISALSQLLIELTEESIHDKEFRHNVSRTGKSFIKELDKKLDLMLNEDESAEQVLNYVTVVNDELKEWSTAIETELNKIISKDKRLNK